MPRRSPPPWHQALTGPLLGLVLDRTCAGCGRGDEPLCAGCATILRAVPIACAPSAPGSPPTWAAAVYEGAVRSLLLEYKERGQHTLAAPLGAALAHAVAAAIAVGPGPVLLVPVPSGTLTVLHRGDDVVLALAEVAAALGRAVGLPVQVLPGLRPAGRRRDQVGLGVLERRANLAGAFAVRPRRAARLAGARVLVVDDIVTSGATLAAASSALTTAGARVVGAAVVAATPAPGR